MERDLSTYDLHCHGIRGRGTQTRHPWRGQRRNRPNILSYSAQAGRQALEQAQAGAERAPHCCRRGQP